MCRQSSDNSSAPPHHGRRHAADVAHWQSATADAPTECVSVQVECGAAQTERTRRCREGRIKVSTRTKTLVGERVRVRQGERQTDGISIAARQWHTGFARAVCTPSSPVVGAGYTRQGHDRTRALSPVQPMRKAHSALVAGHGEVIGVYPSEPCTRALAWGRPVLVGKGLEWELPMWMSCASVLSAAAIAS